MRSRISQLAALGDGVHDRVLLHLLDQRAGRAVLQNTASFVVQVRRGLITGRRLNWFAEQHVAVAAADQGMVSALMVSPMKVAGTITSKFMAPSFMGSPLSSPKPMMAWTARFSTAPGWCWQRRAVAVPPLTLSLMSDTWIVVLGAGNLPSGGRCRKIAAIVVAIGCLASDDQVGEQAGAVLLRAARQFVDPVHELAVLSRRMSSMSTSTGPLHDTLLTMLMPLVRKPWAARPNHSRMTGVMPSH